MEERPYCILKFLLSTVPAKALNSSSRQILADNLDSKQIVLSAKHFARDYRGLGELFGFQHETIKKFEESDDRTMKILEAWETRPDATLDKLISYLQAMDRHDIIEKFIISLRKFFVNYLEYQKYIMGGLKSCDPYNAYVSYADEDKDVVEEFVQKLESRRIGLKLFFRGRDVFTESSDPVADTEFIKRRCRLMLILLTPNYMKSPSLELLLSYVQTLSDEQKQSHLIPAVLVHCETPSILNDMPVLDFSKDYTGVWKNMMLYALCISLRPCAFHYTRTRDCNFKMENEIPFVVSYSRTIDQRSFYRREQQRSFFEDGY